MKKFLIPTFCALMAIYTYAESRITYIYDAAGNRTSRTLILDSVEAMRNTRSLQPDAIMLHEQLGEHEITISPNPVKTDLKITVSGYKSGVKGELTLCAISGEVVISHKITEDVSRINMSQLPDGIYLLNIVVDGKATSWKVIK